MSATKNINRSFSTQWLYHVPWKLNMGIRRKKGLWKQKQKINNFRIHTRFQTSCIIKYFTFYHYAITVEYMNIYVQPKFTKSSSSSSRSVMVSIAMSTTVLSSNLLRFSGYLWDDEVRRLTLSLNLRSIAGVDRIFLNFNFLQKLLKAQWQIWDFWK